MRITKKLHFELAKPLAKTEVAEGEYLEINYGSWYGGREIFDIRIWNTDHSACEKGIKLSRDGLLLLQKQLADLQV